MSRREFLKLLWFGGTVLVLTACDDLIDWVDATSTERDRKSLDVIRVSTIDELRAAESVKDGKIFGQKGLDRLGKAVGRMAVELTRESLLPKKEVNVELIVSAEMADNYDRYPLARKDVGGFLVDQVAFANELLARANYRGIRFDRKMRLGQAVIMSNNLSSEESYRFTADGRWNSDTYGQWPYWVDIRRIGNMQGIDMLAMRDTLDDSVAAYRKFGYLPSSNLIRIGDMAVDLVEVHELLHVLTGIGDAHSFGNAKRMSPAEWQILPKGKGTIRRWGGNALLGRTEMKDWQYDNGIFWFPEWLYETGVQYADMVIPYPESIMSTLGGEKPFSFTPWEMLNYEYNKALIPRGTLASEAREMRELAIPDQMTLKVIDSDGNPLTFEVGTGEGGIYGKRGLNIKRVLVSNGNSAILSKEILGRAWPHAFLYLNTSRGQVVLDFPKSISEVFGLANRVLGTSDTPEVTIRIEKDAMKQIARGGVNYTEITFDPVLDYRNTIRFASAELDGLDVTHYWNLGVD